MGSRGRPFVTAYGLPRVGTQQFAVGVRNARAEKKGWLWLALSGQAVPVAPGCNLYTLNTIATLPIRTNRQGSATTFLPIPQSKNLIGLEVFVQYGVVDPKGCFQNLVNLSDAMRILIGM